MGEKFDLNDPVQRVEREGFSTEHPISAERAREIPLPSPLFHPIRRRKLVDAIAKASFGDIFVYASGFHAGEHVTYKTRSELVTNAEAHERAQQTIDLLNQLEQRSGHREGGGAEEE